jgi:peroxiredoxin
MKHIVIFIFFVSGITFSQSQDSLKVGDLAPYFSGLNQDSIIVSSDSLLKERSLVLVFYRGAWCPYCERHLSDLQDSLMLIKQKGANIVVVTPEKPDSYKKMIENTDASYDILYDEGYRIMSDFNVSYKISKETVPRYLPFVKQFTRKSNGNKEGVLPIPATYVINKDGIIVFKHFDEDYRKRSTIKEILTYL